MTSALFTVVIITPVGLMRAGLLGVGRAKIGLHMIIDIETANRTAVERMTSARPMLTGLGLARDVVPGMRDNLLLHAGPPIEWERMSGPLRGAVIGALIYEGLAQDEAGAVALVERGEVDFEPCHHHSSVGPMAGVTSSSMQVYVVE